MKTSILQASPKIIFFVACAMVCVMVLGATAYARPAYNARSVIAMCPDTGRILYQNDPFTRRYPASITKVMTALLVLENVTDLNQYVTFSPTATAIPSYASRMGIQPGERITVLDALYGIMLPSGNEVARALAEHVSGTQAAFVNAMNQRAHQLGAVNTRFVNPCGLPGAGQYVTAYDVSLIMQEAIRHPVFLDLINAHSYQLSTRLIDGQPHIIRNTNRMVRPDLPEFNPDVIGGKTGFTNAAQHTLTSYVRRGGQGLIITVLYAPRGETFVATQNIMDYVYGQLETKPMLQASHLREKVSARQAEAILWTGTLYIPQSPAEEPLPEPPTEPLVEPSPQSLLEDEDSIPVTGTMQSPPPPSRNSLIVPLAIIALILTLLALGVSNHHNKQKAVQYV